MTLPRAQYWLSLAAFAVVLPWTSKARATNASPTAPRFIDLCPVEADGHRRCDVKILADDAGHPIHDAASPVGGYGPADLQSAYGLSGTGGTNRLVAVFGGNSDYPNAESDLGVYRSQFNLPACTSQNGCFLKVDEHGGTSYPAAGSSELEQALDMEMVSASCPGCRIMLIEGGDMDVALATVISQGASAFSFSVLLGFGSSTASLCDSFGFNKDNGLVITAALGDTKYPGTRDFLPAACQGSLAVGGTSLTKASNPRGWTETAWSGTGSGCSPFVAKPSWQTDTGCGMRMEADVAMVADPGTGMAVYNTLGASGWLVVGGTSAAAPLTAGSLTNIGIANGKFSPAWVWQNPVDFFDITSGTNGPCNSGDPTYYCTSASGYDGPTGWGTVNGSLLAGALPPGTAPTACAMPTGSYAQSCTECVATDRASGCALVCQSCTKIDGSANPGPTLGLPCGGAVANDDGTLRCTGAPDAGPPTADGGAGDASLPPSDAGAGDATVAPTGDAGSVAPIDAGSVDTTSSSNTEAGAPFPSGSDASSGGCDASGGPVGSSGSAFALVVGLAAAWSSRRRERRASR